MNNVGQAYAEYTINKSRLVIRKAHVDGIVLVAIPQTLWSPLQYRSYYPVLAGHPGQRRMYESMQREFYCLHTANAFYATVSSCNAHAQNRVEFKLKKQLQIFSASNLLEFLAIEILRPLPHTADGDQYIFVMTDRY